MSAGQGSYYVYALMDPRFNPARPFYVGKGHGARKSMHLTDAGESTKWRRILEIRGSGLEPIVVELVSSLSEGQSLLLEAQLIGAFGTEATGGMLTNQVVPKGLTRSRSKSLNMPWGLIERAQVGLGILKHSVLELAEANPQGVTNADVASALGLRSHYGGGSKDYLSYSLLGLLLAEGTLVRQGKRHVRTVNLPSIPSIETGIEAPSS